MVRRDRALLALVLVVALGVAPVTYAADDGAEGLPSAVSGSEPADIAFELGYDVESIFRFVADEIRYEPYAGILRGARGTLDARAGNSLDQALLLAALLDESLVPYRFVRGPLADAAVADLVESITTDTDEARRIIESDLARGLEEVLGADASSTERDRGPLARRFEAEASTQAAEAEARLDLAEARLQATMAMILNALDETGLTLGVDAVWLPEAEALDHTWLQVPSGAEWLDLDPTMADWSPGSALAPVAETLERLPDDLRYRVDFEVLVERVEGGRLVTDTALEHAAFADEIAGTPVTFGHVTPSGVERFGVALANVLGAGQLEYRPTLGVGRVSLVADEPVAFGMAEIEGQDGLFEGSDLFADEPASTTGTGPADGEATAEWLNITVTLPGSEPVIARRTIFDRLPADLRHSGEVTPAAVEGLELADLGGAGSHDYLPMLDMRVFSIATGPTSVARSFTRLSDDDLGSVASAYHTLRDAIGARIGLDAGARTFVAGPDIVSLSVDVAEVSPAPTVRIGLDIWHRNQGLLPLRGAPATAPQAELVAGVSAHLAERFSLASLTGVPGVDHDTVGVGEVFETAVAQGIPIRVLTGSAAGSLPYAPEAAQLIEDALALGDVVVAPATPVVFGDTERVGWWRIDPATGVTRDVMDDGSGQEVVEYATLESGRVQQIICFGAMRHWAAGQIIAAAALVATLSESAIFRLFNHPSGWGGARCFAL